MYKSVLLKQGFKSFGLFQIRYYRQRTNITNLSHIPSLRTKNIQKTTELLQLNVNSKKDEIESLKKLGFDLDNTTLDDDGNGNSNFDDILIEYLKFTSSVYKKSTKSLNKLKLQLKNADQLEGKTKLNILIDFLLNEFRIEINIYEREGINGLEKMRQYNSDIAELNKDIDDENYLLSQLFKTSENIQDDNTSNNGSLFNNANFIFNILSNIKKEIKLPYIINELPIPVEQIAEIFEISKQLPLESDSMKGIYLSGSILYGTGKIRMDPVNESFYINSLVKFKKYDQALQLFNSRKLEINQRWWYELGMTTALKSNNINTFDKLLIETDKNFNTNSYLKPNILTLAVRKKIQLGNLNVVDKLMDRFIKCLQNFGYDNVDSPKKPFIQFNDEDQANEYLNAMVKPNVSDMAILLSYLMHRKNLDKAIQLIETIIALPNLRKNDLVFVIKYNKLNLLKNSALLTDRISKNYINRDKEAKATLKKFEKVLSELIEETYSNSVYKDFFYESFESLSENPVLTSMLHDFITEYPLSASKFSDSPDRLQQLFKFLLKTDYYNKAMKLLNKVEYLNSSQNENSKEIDTSSNNSLSAIHYGEFLDYYLTKSINGYKRKSKIYNDKVGELVERMEKNNITIDFEFVSKLLTFYRQHRDFNNCFKIINQILSAKLEDPKDSEVIDEIPTELYMEIWECYRSYYKYFIDVGENMNPKSNSNSWNTIVKKTTEDTFVHPTHSCRELFNLLVHQDEILPSEKFYNVIIKTMLSGNDFASLPPILIFMYEVHGIVLDKKMSKFVMKGLERAYINSHLRSKGASVDVNKNSLENVTKHIKQIKESGKILKDIQEDDIPNFKISEEVIRLLKHHKTDVIPEKEVISAASSMNIDSPLLRDILKPVNNLH
ncbi:hypothetical protein Kpol_1073p10 [Vanderwaltozyma polyspora DSM 70294]|uniref:Uncharacterized protein n=1 Tax=Vanderwaltozyma polyspora (strain ATCC 22028 / DSM 70294 / BCRC 21397 / CBS 2163 / NBRC 10782 / NRRL Y-8283 / UCD 57-17) TaxID=436907 RepID=A7TPS3_VANPO|nr:uncharacterized protein Kpol_1073p10 [Vanderwaltozyma polyspora DSM 70294]EDO15724.1 hypothetical protein Kpol_1073p10 [Vanderwaltozyma polyspora DSM 70294]